MSGIFTDLEKQLLERIGQPISLLPGNILYMEGDAASKIYYIKQGRVRVYRNISSGREVTLDVVEAGHIVGESAVIPGGDRPTCVAAVNEVLLYAFTMQEIMPYMTNELWLHFLQQCSATMDRLVDRLEEQCLLDRYGKVASFLVDLAKEESSDKGISGGKIPYTHENVAESLGLSRSTVTLVLKELERKGWVKSGYGFIRIDDIGALRNFVEQQKEGK